MTAEDSICVDIISNGRFDLGVGQGYSYMEFDAFRMKREERSARMHEGVRLVQRLWNEENVTFDGKFTQVKNMTLSPQTGAEPHADVDRRTGRESDPSRSESRMPFNGDPRP